MTDDEREAMKRGIEESNAKYYKARQRRALESAVWQQAVRMPLVILFVVLLIAML